MAPTTTMTITYLVKCRFLLLCSIFVLGFSPSTGKETSASNPPKTLLLPLTKDPSTLQYLTHINQRTPLVTAKLTLDLGGQYLWIDCQNGYVSSSYKPVRCNTARCKLARSKSCNTECYSSPKPGCNNNTCALLPDNTVTGTVTGGEVGQDAVRIHSTDKSGSGYESRSNQLPNLIFVCGSTSLLDGLASGVKGMAGLGRTGISLPSQISSYFKIERKFAICLSSTNGVVFFGKLPFDVEESIDYSTPLLLNPVSTASGYYSGDPSSDYFLQVTSIQIDGTPVPLNDSLLIINEHDGTRGTKISTVHPYTVMQTSIYKSVAKAFAAALPHGVARVHSVAPFGLCFNATNIGTTYVGPAVPTVEIVLQRGTVPWKFFGANSMVRVKKDVTCLGFVDGGLNPRTSIVIGGHQLEDYLLQFDLANKRLFFSSSLLLKKTTCSTFTPKP